ncbi:hypothetical protein KSS87_006425 [Heliosperma pusillum]|nr:hypothetical protein KSS87_006425 [Heliosperma pusillum]
MAMGRNTRVDGRKSSNYCSTILLVVMVAACLIGAWIMMPSLVDPEGNIAVSLGMTKLPKLEKLSQDTSREFNDDTSQQNETSENPTELIREEKVDTSEEQDENIMYNDGSEETSVSKDKEIGYRNTGEDTEHESRKRTDESEVKTDESEGKSSEKESYSSKEKTEEIQTQDEVDSENLEQVGQDGNKDLNEDSDERTSKGGSKDQTEILKEASTQIGAWSTQSKESQKQKESVKASLSKNTSKYKWKLCNVSAGPDYIPCLDNIQAIRKLPSTSHYEHRERHCPDEAPSCLVSLPEGYKISVKWPKSREKIWFANVPHIKLAEVKGHQNWVQASGEYLTFPGGGTQFMHGALHYIDFIQKIWRLPLVLNVLATVILTSIYSNKFWNGGCVLVTVSDIAWGKQTRVILDVGCGVASFGGYLFDRDVITMSLAPKDEHEAQVQFALERGIPAISAVMGTKRLPFPSMVFDIVHCARCRVPWHIEGGKLLLELNRVLRPGGFFVWSATPVYRSDTEDVAIWKAMSKLTKSMCWELLKIGKDKVNGVSAAVYRKPTSNDCYEQRTRNDPPLCEESDDPNAAWDVSLQACMHKIPTHPSERGYQWPAKWPLRLEKHPYWLQDSEVGVYGKAAPKDFVDDYKHWKLQFENSYLNGIGIDWSSLRNVMDMRAVYGGFAAALKDMKLWVMNVVPVTSSDTLAIIYERGLFGIYHDWCESFNTYPRTYDLLHADHLFSDIKKRCEFVAVMAEVDRILRPEGRLIVRDDAETIAEVEAMAKSLQWKIHLTFSKDNEGLVSVQKTKWRPSDVETIT